MTLPSLWDAFGYDYMQRALVAGLLVALVCTLLGVFAVLRGMSLISDGLAHISFSGIALGLVLGMFPLELALALTVIGAIGIELVRAKGWVKSDLAIGLFFTAGLAVGGALVQRHNINPTRYLFGSILTITPHDLRWVLALSLVLIACIIAFYKELVYVAFNEEAARISGLPVGTMNFVASILMGIAVALASRFAGALLASALIIVPAATGLQLARSFRGTLVASASIGTLAVVAGLYASFALDVGPGPAIALLCLGLFVIAATKNAVLPAS